MEIIILNSFISLLYKGIVSLILSPLKIPLVYGGWYTINLKSYIFFVGAKLNLDSAFELGKYCMKILFIYYYFFITFLFGRNFSLSNFSKSRIRYSIYVPFLRFSFLDSVMWIFSHGIKVYFLVKSKIMYSI